MKMELCRVSIDMENESLLAKSQSHNRYGRHSQICSEYSKTFSRTRPRSYKMFFMLNSAIIAGIAVEYLAGIAVEVCISLV